jgi:hypothetical protein
MATMVQIRRTVRGDGAGEVPGRMAVGRLGVCDDTELGDPIDGDAGGEA